MESSPNDLNAKQLPAGAAKWTIIGEIREEKWGEGMQIRYKDKMWTSELRNQINKSLFVHREP